MDERLRFVARLLDGGTMTGACQKFGFFRKTGYKIPRTAPRDSSRESRRSSMPGWWPPLPRAP
jgi:hypothetical protein